MRLKRRYKIDYANIVFDVTLQRVASCCKSVQYTYKRVTVHVAQTMRADCREQTREHGDS